MDAQGTEHQQESPGSDVSRHVPQFASDWTFPSTSAVPLPSLADGRWQQVPATAHFSASIWTPHPQNDQYQFQAPDDDTAFPSPIATQCQQSAFPALPSPPGYSHAPTSVIQRSESQSDHAMPVRFCGRKRLSNAQELESPDVESSLEAEELQPFTLQLSVQAQPPSSRTSTLPSPPSQSTLHQQAPFEMPKQRRHELWQFVRLIPKDEYRILPIMELRSEHAKSAFCLRCCAEIEFTKGKHKVKEHMEAHHVLELHSHRKQLQSAKDDMENKRLVNIFSSSPVQPEAKGFQLASIEDQKHADDLLAMWVAESLRPLSIVEDSGFIKYVQHINKIVGKIKVPSRQILRDRIQTKATELRMSLKKRIKRECVFFSASSDIWTSRSNSSFISLTIHCLDKEFILNNWILEVEELPGKHSGEAITHTLASMFDRWSLKKAHCTMFLRDGASNGVKACNDLGVRHMSCLAHSLHLVVSAGLIRKRGENSFIQLIELAESDTELEEALGEKSCEEVEAFVKESLVSRADLDYVRDVVHKFRKLATYFHKSPKATTRIKAMQKNRSTPLGTITDSPTRWSSALSMLVRMIELRAAFDDFFGYLHDTEGAKEFGDVKTTLVRPTSEHWFIVQCLVEILNGFSAATELLSGDKYPTLVFALPVLRSVKVTLQNEAIFDGVAASVAGERFVDRALSLMHSVRRSFISLFNERFRGAQDELLWISYLDPDLRQQSI